MVAKIIALGLLPSYNYNEIDNVKNKDNNNDNDDGNGYEKNNENYDDDDDDNAYEINGMVSLVSITTVARMLDLRINGQASFTLIT